jgi:hypothetical protein
VSNTAAAAWGSPAEVGGENGTEDDAEWWYFDAHLDDGATLVVAFMNKDLAAPQKPLEPLIRLNLDLPELPVKRSSGVVSRSWGSGP